MKLPSAGMMGIVPSQSGATLSWLISSRHQIKDERRVWVSHLMILGKSSASPADTPQGFAE